MKALLEYAKSIKIHFHEDWKVKNMEIIFLRLYSLIHTCII